MLETTPVPHHQILHPIARFEGKSYKEIYQGEKGLLKVNVREVFSLRTLFDPLNALERFADGMVAVRDLGRLANRQWESITEYYHGKDYKPSPWSETIKKRARMR